MVTSATKQTLFLEKPELKAAMMLTVLGPPKISESKLLFCINHTGSGMVTVQLVLSKKIH